jgi:pimeloyl-ACP methyl ester carboxylesterase
VKRAAAVVAAAVTVALVLTACSSGGERASVDRRPRPAPATTEPASTTSAPAIPAPPPIDWGPCPDGGRDECGTLSVPLDYDDPTRDTITLALRRSPATDPSRRLGSIVVNPGGPGGSGFGLGASLQRSLQRSGAGGGEVASRYDFIGFDPRGVSASTPVDCADDLDPFYADDATPDDDAERAALIAAMERHAQSCAARSGLVLPYVSTRDAARDLEQIRRALGDERLNFIGYSYGTELGTLYAEEFPDRVGRIVLDGAVDPDLDGVELAREQARSLEASFDRFVADCAAETRCPYHSGGDPGGAFDRLMARLDASPLHARDGRTVNASQAVSGIATALFDTSQWPTIASALGRAELGDGTALLELFDDYPERAPDGSYPNLPEANNAINCLDYVWPRRDAGYDALVTDLRAEAPRFGQAFLREFLPCAYWPVPPRPKGEFEGKATATPVLVVGTTNDPSTPYAWSEALAEAIPGAVLLTYDGDGHTAYLRDPCIDAAVNTYLLDGTPPAAGTVC